MNIAFSGCRDKDNIPAQELRSSWQIMTTLLDDWFAERNVLVGDCPTGVDEIIRRWFDIEINSPNCYKADWDTHHKAAGPIRNKAMIDDADGLIAFWDGKSKGTKNCIKCATDKGIPVLIISVK